jgi:prepilin-type N-terminal cleavage/methylation domain-containing protein
VIKFIFSYIFMIKKGFSLIELLIVIAISAILFKIVLTSLSNARTKAYNVSFKLEVGSLIPKLNDICESADIANAAQIANLHSFTTFAVGNIAVAGNGNEINCYPDGTFQVTITPSNGSACTNAILKETEVSYTGC